MLVEGINGERDSEQKSSVLNVQFSCKTIYKLNAVSFKIPAAILTVPGQGGGGCCPWGTEDQGRSSQVWKRDRKYRDWSHPV